MQIYKLRKNKKKKKAFTLIEVIVALGILSIIAVTVFPSLTNLFKNSKSNKNQARVIFALEEAIEISKNKKEEEFVHQVNGINVKVSISDYEEDSNFKLIRASYGDKELRLVVDK